MPNPSTVARDEDPGCVRPRCLNYAACCVNESCIAAEVDRRERRLTIAEDGEGDWAAIYAGDDCIHQGHVGETRFTLIEFLAIERIDADGVGEATEAEGWPESLAKLRRATR